MKKWCLSLLLVASVGWAQTYNGDGLGSITNASQPADTDLANKINQWQRQTRRALVDFGLSEHDTNGHHLTTTRSYITITNFVLPTFSGLPIQTVIDTTSATMTGGITILTSSTGPYDGTAFPIKTNMGVLLGQLSLVERLTNSSILVQGSINWSSEAGRNSVLLHIHYGTNVAQWISCGTLSNALNLANISTLPIVARFPRSALTGTNHNFYMRAGREAGTGTNISINGQGGTTSGIYPGTTFNALRCSFWAQEIIP